MRPARVALCCVSSAATLLVGAPEAVAGDYVVAQCHPANVSHEASAEGADRGDYGMRDECSVAPDRSLKVVATSSAPSSHRGFWFWQAPPGTQIVAVNAEAKLRRADGHKARLYVADDAGRQIATVGSGTDGATSFTAEHWSATSGSDGITRFYAALICENNGAICPPSAEAKTFVRNVELTLRDVSSPTVSVIGAGAEPGWKRGDLSFQPTFFDYGGGVHHRVVTVNGSAIPTGPACSPSVVSGFAIRLSPCLFQLGPEKLVYPSSSRPFADGLNRLAFCASDFSTGGSANGACGEAAVLIDNTDPAVSFVNAQERSDPELIEATASDATSGLDRGSALIEFRQVGESAWMPVGTTLSEGVLGARVDSARYAPGSYEFRASISDAAGNRTSSLLRADLTPMQLQFPLKDEVDLDAFFPGGQTKEVVGYRQPGAVRGFLLRPDGSPVSGERLTIDQRFDDGSLVRRRLDHTRTQADGSFRLRLPGGPSRSISVRYPGSARFQPDATPDLDFNVKSQVALKVRSRIHAGGTALFRGKVGRYFARLPSGGKLVELQYKKRAKTWNTAKEAIGTSSAGTVSVGYRFRRYYTQPVTFVFRLKVTRESRWPYRLPAASKPKLVTVVPIHR